MKFNKIEKITIICFIILIFVASILFIIADRYAINTNNMVNTNNTSTRNIQYNNIVDNNTANGQLMVIPKNVCEGCHMSGKGSVPQAMTVKPHLNGGNYCLICHNFSHDKHPINKNVTCEKCHGFKNETIPVSGPNIVCINCHDYPNALNKSLGNLLTIHRSREISCINCHADRCTKCHKEIGNDTRWEKRFTHFRTILGNFGKINTST